MIKNRQTQYYYISSSGPHFIWGAFWVISVFSIDIMSKNNEFVWIGILFAVGWLSVLIAQLLLPFLSNISARRSFIIFEMTEATLFLLFPLLVFSGLVLYFIILTFIVGILDEVGKGTLPPIFKAISENNLKHNVSFFRSWNMVARILGIVASGIAYYFIGSYAYFVLAAILFTTVLPSIRFPRNIEVITRSEVHYNIRQILHEFRCSKVFKYFSIFTTFQIFDGIFYVVLVVYVTELLMVDSISYSIWQVIMYSGGIMGALLFSKLKFKEAKIVAYTSFGTPIVVFVLVFLHDMFFIVLFTFIFILLTSLRGTLYTHIIYKSHHLENVALIFVVYTFAISLSRILGNLSGDWFLTYQKSISMVFFLIGILFLVNAFLSAVILLKDRNFVSTV
ncbi:MAG: MFS transporter [Thermoplasmataceae archaeon]